MTSDLELSKTFKIEKISDSVIFIEILQGQSQEAENGRQADLIAEQIGEVVNQQPERSFDFLIDLTKAGSITYISPHARQVYLDLPKISKFNKAAIVGQSLLLEVTINLLMQATGRGQSFKWFKDKEEAKKWLLA